MGARVWKDENVLGALLKAVKFGHQMAKLGVSEVETVGKAEESYRSVIKEHGGD